MANILPDESKEQTIKPVTQKKSPFKPFILPLIDFASCSSFGNLCLPNPAFFCLFPG